ncbi:CBO0543 family protein [Alteribacillus sp. JSM 102045]|uniref:CBO0543 family protein n=1 Tax=Alteribacillus sp. JSM 102045 TaxID=1562101 RepID=UPI0035BF5EE0
MKSTAERLKKWRVQSLQKKQYFSSVNNKPYAYIITALFASLAGTYLDLIFVGKGIYHFPIRLFPEIFTINIVFTLFFLPLFTILFLFVAKRVHFFIRWMIILITGAAIFFIEQITEQLGWFVHDTDWSHVYSFIGYMLFLFMVWKLFLFFYR